jgi:hypothetical protein
MKPDPTGSRPPVDISGPGFPCNICVEERDLVAVAECVRDQWWRCGGQVFVQGGVSCAEQFKAEASESVHDGVWVEVLAGSGSGEEPGAFRVRCCSEVGAVLKVLAEEFREGLWYRYWMRAEGDPDRAGGVVDPDCVGPEPCHPDKGLGIEEEQCSGDSVGQGFAGACEQFP